MCRMLGEAISAVECHVAKDVAFVFCFGLFAGSEQGCNFLSLNLFLLLLPLSHCYKSTDPSKMGTCTPVVISIPTQNQPYNPMPCAPPPPPPLPALFLRVLFNSHSYLFYCHQTIVLLLIIARHVIFIIIISASIPIALFISQAPFQNLPS